MEYTLKSLQTTINENKSVWQEVRVVINDKNYVFTNHSDKALTESEIVQMLIEFYNIE